MLLDHERLDVYHRALDFLVLANAVIEGLPRGKSHLAAQLSRASLSIVLNIAEGTGRPRWREREREFVCKNYGFLALAQPTLSVNSSLPSDQYLSIASRT